MSRSELARQLYARGERDNRAIADAVGMTPAAVWYALKAKQHQTSAAPDKPTAADHDAGLRIATMRGTVQDRALAIAEEIARTRAQAQRGK